MNGNCKYVASLIEDFHRCHNVKECAYISSCVEFFLRGSLKCVTNIFLVYLCKVIQVRSTYRMLKPKQFAIRFSALPKVEGFVRHKFQMKFFAHTASPDNIFSLGI